MTEPQSVPNSATQPQPVQSQAVPPRLDRRRFLSTASAVAAAGAAGYWVGPRPAAAFDTPNARPVVGFIGTGDRWKAVGPNAMKYGDAVVCCDVDSRHAESARARCKDIQSKRGVTGDVDVCEDYRKVLDRKDVQTVVIVTTDHWHTKIAIEAMQAGKDVYCEKPLTLTIDEGKQIIKTLEQTKRVFQVGTQQRSEMNLNFLRALAIVKDGRLGKIQKVECRIGGVKPEGPFPVAPVPKELNWEMWLGQAPLVDYREKRCHYQFRWWYEYSGGKMTDWGAHHVDIAQWAIGMENSGPLTVEGTASHPCEFKNGYPVRDDIYNVANKFHIQCAFPNGVEMVIRDDLDNGILIEGTDGRIFVSRGKLTGAPVEELASKPLPDDAITKLYKGKTPGDHMRNFYECMVTREQPISDVHTHHRAMTTCHLANIAIRLGRKLKWDPQTQQILDDEEANRWQSREQRKGYEIKA